jgi:hypothetical protein
MKHKTLTIEEKEKENVSQAKINTNTCGIQHIMYNFEVRGYSNNSPTVGSTTTLPETRTLPSVRGFAEC